MTKTFIDILEQLEKTSGLNDKIAILKKNKDNEQLKQYLFFAMDDRVTFGISKLKPEATSDSPLRKDAVRFDQFTAMCCQFSNRIITGNKAQALINSFLNICTELEKKWYTKAIQKDLASIGIGGSSVNKAFEEKFILDFNCSGAKSEDSIKKMLYKADGQWKVNGFRIFFYTGPDGKRHKTSFSELLSPIGRSGLPIPNFDFLWPYIEAFGLANKVFDGEVECDDNLQEIQSLFGFDLNLTADDFRGKSGKVGKGWDDYQARRAEVKDIQDRTKFRIFEILDRFEFESEDIKDDYLTRRKFLTDNVQPIIDKVSSYAKEINSPLMIISDRVSIVEAETVDNEEEAYTLANRYIKSGKEGIVLKAHSGKYGFTKDNSQIKVKCKTDDVDCKIKRFEFAKVSYKTDGTPYPLMAGRVIVEYFNDKGELKESGVGTGKFLTRAIKLDMAAHPENYIDRIVVCTSQEFTKDEGVMSCPRIDSMRPRQDKNKI